MAYTLHCPPARNFICKKENCLNLRCTKVDYLSGLVVEKDKSQHPDFQLMLILHEGYLKRMICRTLPVGHICYYKFDTH